MNYFILLFLLILLNIFRILDAECHTLSKNYYLYTASPTPYRHVFHQSFIKEDTKKSSNECSAKKIWMFIRHGTRYPGKKFIAQLSNDLTIRLKNNILENFYSGQSSLCKNDIKKLKSWQNSISSDENKFLAHEGEDEIIEIAERYQKRYPNLFPEKYSNTTLKIKFTDTQRTIASAKYFLIGLYGRHVSKHVWFPEPKNPDPILRSYKMCQRWLNEVYKQPIGLSEVNKFKSSNIIKEIITRINRRLGFSEESINIDDITLMYKTCGFESSFNKNHPSPWCSIFNDDDFKILEYLEDLRHYSFHGYAFNISRQSSCPLLCDLMDFLSSNEQDPRASVYFSHSGALLKFLSVLGLYKDSEPLTGDLFYDNRQWRLGKIAPFAGNIAFVLSQCDSTMQLSIFHNEKLISLPWNNKKYISLDNFLNLYKNIYDNCNFDQICENRV